MILTSVTIGGVTHGLDLAGVGANAVLGGVKAREHNFDIVGFMTLALVSGLGGGIIRDTLLQHGPPLALTHPSYLATALGGALVAYLVRIRGPVWEHSYRMVDALAIGCWAAAGAQRTLLVGLSWLAAILLGTITAVAGGVVRDVLLRDVPEILGGRRLYATSAAAASGVVRLREPDRGRGGRRDRRRGGPLPAQLPPRLEPAAQGALTGSLQISLVAWAVTDRSSPRG